MSELPLILEDADNELTPYSRELFNDLYIQLKNMSIKIMEYDQQIENICTNNPLCKLVCKLLGIGPLTATAIIALIGNVKIFKNGRELAAYLGLVPKQHSSGGKTKLLGISKRGDRYVRCLLIHGARAVLFRAKNLPVNKENWLKELILRRGFNRTVVALANKNARTIWAIMTKGENFIWST